METIDLTHIKRRPRKSSYIGLSSTKNFLGIVKKELTDTLRNPLVQIAINFTLVHIIYIFANK